MELTFHRRDVDIVVISDVHLGTPACRADDLLAYLKSVRPAGFGNQFADAAPIAHG